LCRNVQQLADSSKAQILESPLIVTVYM